MSTIESNLSVSEDILSVWDVVGPMGTLCFTIDFDRDSNTPVEGVMPASSMFEGKIVPPRFSASADGAAILVEMLDDLGISGTFFAEAETLSKSRNVCISGHEVALHGLAHENLAGLYSGKHMSEVKIKEIVRTSCDIVADVVGTRPLGFRAPYMKPPACLPHILSSMGFKYDSSYYSEVGQPYGLGDGLVEIPALRVSDGKGGKITSYLWPMHENKRKPSDFEVLHDAVGKGILVLATHTWHMCATSEGRAMEKEECEANLRKTVEVIESALDTGFKAKACIDVARSFVAPK